jgi:hypothetical protein
MRDPIKDVAVRTVGIAVNARLRTFIRSQPSLAR